MQDKIILWHMQIANNGILWKVQEDYYDCKSVSTKSHKTFGYMYIDRGYYIIIIGYVYTRRQQLQLKKFVSSLACETLSL